MFWKASIWRQTTYVKQQKFDLKDRRYLVTYIACLQKSSWESILTNFTILLLYQYWSEWNKAHRILRCIRATFPAVHSLQRPSLAMAHTVLCSVTAGPKQPNAVHLSTMHIYLPHGWIYDSTERNFSKLQFRSSIAPFCGFIAATTRAASWKSRYVSQNRPYLDKRTPNPSEKEAMIVAFTFARDNSHTHTTWLEHAYQQGLEVGCLHDGPI